MARSVHRGFVIGMCLAAGAVLLWGCTQEGCIDEGPVARPLDKHARHDCGIGSKLAERLAHPDASLPLLQADYSAPGSVAPAVACYSRENPPPPEVIARMEEELYGLSLQYQLAARWAMTASGPTGSTGNPVTITWSLPPDGLVLVGGETPRTNVLFSRMDQLFGGNRALWIQRITDSLNRWSQVAGVTYIRIAFNEQDWDDGAAWGTAGFLGRRGDVRIAMMNIDGPSQILAFNGYPPQGDMVLDASENWAAPGNSHRFMRNIVTHENGHGMGLAHVCPANETKVMEPFLSESFDGPQEDDIRGMQRHYGDAFEGDNSSSIATNLGTRPVSSTLNFGAPPTVVPSVPSNLSVPALANASTLSIDADGEQDWFRFTLTRPLLVTTTVTPVGTTYDDNAQGADDCPEGNPVNARTRANLRVQLVDGDGFTTIATADSGGVGAPEVLTQVLLPTGETFIRVTESNVPTATQLYRVTVVTGAGLNLTASDGTFADRITLTWSAIPSSATYTVFRGTTTDRDSALAIATRTVTNYTDTAALRGPTYYYWIQAHQIADYPVDMGGPEAGFRTPPPCPADFNGDGARDPDDLSDFVTCFFLDVMFPNSCPAADFNQDTFRDPDDLSDFITAFFLGC